MGWLFSAQVSGAGYDVRFLHGVGGEEQLWTMFVCGLARAAQDQHVDWSDGHSLGYRFLVLDAPASQGLAADSGWRSSCWREASGSRGSMMRRRSEEKEKVESNSESRLEAVRSQCSKK